MFFNKKSYSW